MTDRKPTKEELEAAEFLRDLAERPGPVGAAAALSHLAREGARIGELGRQQQADMRASAKETLRMNAETEAKSKGTDLPLWAKWAFPIGALLVGVAALVTRLLVG